MSLPDYDHPKDKQPIGRPAMFSQELADAICDRISEGESLRSICLDANMPTKTSVFRWLNADKDFSDHYARAREEQAETLADELIAIADEECTIVASEDGNTEVKFDSVAVARNRLRVDTRKWVVSKLKPKKYGDKLDLTHGGSINTNVTSELTEAQIVARLAEIQAAKKVE